MEKEKINQFIMINGKFFPEMMFEDVKQKLESLDESKESMLMATEWKNPTVAFLFAFFLGGLGVDRFWLGETGLGVVKLITCAGAGIWTIIDYFLIMKVTKEKNLEKFITGM